VPILVQFNNEELGPMIDCDTYEECVAQAVQLAADEGYAFTNEDSLAMSDGGVLLPSGNRLQVGEVESPREEY
jgi:hypothetical protein